MDGFIIRSVSGFLKLFYIGKKIVIIGVIVPRSKKNRAKKFTDLQICCKFRNFYMMQRN